MPYQEQVAADLAALRQRFALIADLSQVCGLLDWDRHTYLPPLAGEARGRQSAAVEAVVHEKLADQRVGQWLARLEDAQLEPDDARLVKLCRRRFDRAVRIPLELVESFALARAQAQQAWLEARAANDFALYAPALRRVFQLSRQRAEAIGYEEHPYDALHAPYEPGSGVLRLRTLFERLRPALVSLLERASSNEGQDAPLHGDFDERSQEEFVREEVARFGFDFDRGRLDSTVHPFAQGIDPTDVRITTRYRRSYLAASIFATFHEAGHGMYEQGLPLRWRQTPLAESVSLGLHESQSRLWENLVGRSLPYWRGAFPRLQARFPQALSKVGVEEFYRAVNCVRPSFIRVEADELTYNLHVIARFELEAALLDGSLEVEELPAAWNRRYQELLGITPPDDLRGVLQDVHWSMGLIGYFPTYTLGNVMSAQLFETARDSLPRLDLEIEHGEFAGLSGWLKAQVHDRGSFLDPDDLLTEVTGRPLDVKPYLTYLEEKFMAIRATVEAA